MHKGEKIALLVGGALLALGLVSTFIIFMINGFSVTRVYNLEERAVEENIDSKLNSIVIDAVEADTIISLATDNKNKVAINDTNKIYHEISVENNTLRIKRKNSFGFFYHFVPINHFKMSITLSLTEEALEQLNIKTVSGDIHISNINGNDLNIETVSGAVSLDNIKSSSTNIKMVSGSLNIDSLSTKKLHYKTVSGDSIINNTKALSTTIRTISSAISMNGFECDLLDAESISGDIKIEFLTDKQFDCKTISGRCVVPSSIRGAGLAKIKTTSGDIIISIAKA